MRFLLRYKYGIFQQKTERFYLKDITTTDELLKLVAAKANFKVTDIILRYRSENGTPYRIIPGWDLSHYELKDGSELEVQVLEKQEQELSNAYTNKYMLNLFGSRKLELANVAEQDEKEEDDSNTASKQVFDVRKYLDQELEVLLKYVQKGKLNSVLKLLRDYPKDIELETTAEIRYLKPKLINQLGQGGWGAIHYAAYCKQIQILKELISQDADVNKTTSDGWSPLQLVVNRKNLDEMTLLLNTQSIDINLLTQKGTALHVAAKSGYALGIQLLLNKKVDTKVQDQSGKTALDYCDDSICRGLLLPNDQTQSIKQQSPKQDISHLTILKGSLFKLQPVFFTLQERFFVLDPYQGMFIRYKTQECYPKKPKQIIPLSTITSIKILRNSEKTWQMKKQYTYLEVNCSKKMYLVSKHQEIMNIWFQGLNHSINFYNKKQKQLMKSKLVIKQCQKNIMLLDDTNNKFIPIKEYSEKDAESKIDSSKSKSQKTIVKDQNLEPKMPAVLASVSSQNVQTNTSFGSELDTSKKLRKRSSASDDDLDNISLSYSSSRNGQKVQFSSFQIIKQLGSGAFGKVFLARLIQTGQQFALKALKKRNLILSKQKKFAIEEVNILKQVNHPFIINLNYSFQTPQYLYLALDYCSGRDLNSHRDRQETFSEEDTRFYIAQLILAIEYLHSKKILYRDLKPENILLDAEGHIKLTDFGLSKSNVQNKATSFVGTHAYVSPELLSGAGIDRSADLYGIGCIMYQCLVGTPPYFSEDIPTLYKNIQHAQLQYPKDMSRSAKSLIKSLLQRNPEKRLGYSSIDEIKSHQFFKGMDWMKILLKQTTPPFRKYLGEQDEDDELDQLALFNSESKFLDVDYSQNSKVNRFNGFSFTR